MYIHYNGNPCGQNSGDCVIRAISIATGMSRHKVYAGLCLQGFPCTIWGNSNEIWSEYLLNLGYKRHEVEVNQTVAQFASDHPRGRYIIGTGKHAVCVMYGNIIDSWDSSNQRVRYYFSKE